MSLRLVGRLDATATRDLCRVGNDILYSNSHHQGGCHESATHLNINLGLVLASRSNGDGGGTDTMYEMKLTYEDVGRVASR